MEQQDLSRIPNLKSGKYKEKLYKDHSHLNDGEILKEILYIQKTQAGKLERIRSNTSTMVWWLIAIPIISVILMFFMGVFAAVV